ncbi:MAG: primosomal protein N', partial [Ignavibacteriales bacterium]|nr:primosomal protein N' [Ignavibacteriales bacterium]
MTKRSKIRLELFVQVAVPLPFRKLFTYSVPDELKSQIQIGVRVVIPFAKRTLTGFVITASDKSEYTKGIKPIVDVLDDKPIFNEKSYKFYEWLADYYLCSIGEALRNSVPHGSEIESKRKVVADKELCKSLFEQENKKNSIKAKLLQILSEKEVQSISSLQKTVNKKNIYSVLRELELQGIVSILNLIEQPKAKQKTLKYVKLAKSIDEVYEYLPNLEIKSPKKMVVLLELLSNKEKE